MTHASTEMPLALRLADAVRTHDDHPRVHFYNRVAAELRRLHARVQELESSQAQRVPLDYHDIAMAHVHIGAHGQLPATERIVRWTEAAHGITQEKQG